MRPTDALPYLFRWDRHGRKGQPCRVTARSRRTSGHFPVAFGDPRPRPFNSVCVAFADGFAMVVSGNALRKA